MCCFLSFKTVVLTEECILSWLSNMWMAKVFSLIFTESIHVLPMLARSRAVPRFENDLIISFHRAVQYFCRHCIVVPGFPLFESLHTRRTWMKYDYWLEIWVWNHVVGYSPSNSDTENDCWTAWDISSLVNLVRFWWVLLSNFLRFSQLTILVGQYSCQCYHGAYHTSRELSLVATSGV